MLEKEALEILGNIPLFRGLNHEDLRQVLATCTREVVKPAQVVMKEGAIGNALYIVVRGELEAYLPEHVTDAERFYKILLNKMRTGDIFCEYSLVDKNSVSATVAAAEETLLFKMTRMAFEDLVNTSNRIGKFIYRNLLVITIDRLRQKDKELDMFNLNRWATD
jgi:CRP/FNR family cyclic AMP-dependent transcriptional regulator